MRARVAISGRTNQRYVAVNIAEADDPGIVRDVDGFVDGDVYVYWPKTGHTTWATRAMLELEGE